MHNNKLKKIAEFDPSSIGVDNGNLFSLPFTTEESEIVVIPMPWDVTVSYRDGAMHTPATVLQTSKQVDLYDHYIKDVWKLGISMLPVPKYWISKNKDLRKKAIKCIEHLENYGKASDKKVSGLYKEINAASRELNEWIKEQSLKFLKQGKSVCVLGGEHSVGYGLMQALTKYYKKYSILHIDAHCDLRNAYEGFEFSHASIQFNAAKIKEVEKMVQVGIRDYCKAEDDLIKNSKGRIVGFDDTGIKRKLYEGVTWKKICEEIIKPLGKDVYISFDIDALDPALCPHTGTPVPGGLQFEQVFYLVEALIKSGRKIIGYDLCEVAPGINDDWDCMVGARVLYRLSNLMAKSQGKI